MDFEFIEREVLAEENLFHGCVVGGATRNLPTCMIFFNNFKETGSRCLVKSKKAVAACVSSAMKS